MNIIELENKVPAGTIDLVVDFLREHFDPEIEEVRALFLDKERNIHKHILLETGVEDTVNNPLKKTFAHALAWDDVGSLLIAHNHPNGSPLPSINDIMIAKENHFLANQFDVELYQLIIGEKDENTDGYFDLTKIVSKDDFFERFFVMIGWIEENAYHHTIGEILYGDKELE